ncbi:hypothetical protein [Symbioplanes lichenis]|uniref:hypothetical protein n=1 Tax=Symbioplanes lichenis TaxID=1629072 RepID=UPI0027383ADD|nr:hypothetical protein [Actinoplanes lichenis]
MPFELRHCKHLPGADLDGLPGARRQNMFGKNTCGPNPIVTNTIAVVTNAISRNTVLTNAIATNEFLTNGIATNELVTNGIAGNAANEFLTSTIVTNAGRDGGTRAGRDGGCQGGGYQGVQGRQRGVAGDDQVEELPLLVIDPQVRHGNAPGQAAGRG